MIRRYKPGPGWRRLGGSVWQHDDGTRVHLAGLVLLANGEFVWLTSWPNSQRFSTLERIVGSRRRAVFVFANELRNAVKGGES